MYYYKVVTNEGIDYVEITTQLNGENIIPLTRDEYLAIIERLVKESNPYEGEF